MGSPSLPVRQLLRSNLLILLCCAFYLAWWLLTFRTSSPPSGLRTGWLLLPAFFAGLAGMLLAIRGIRTAPAQPVLFPGKWVAWGGFAAYLLLAAVTRLLLRRPVTTELLLIVGWTVLMLLESSALYSLRQISHRLALALTLAVSAAACFYLVCYVLYDRLSPRAGYLDGSLPLVSAMLFALGFAGAIMR